MQADISPLKMVFFCVWPVPKNKFTKRQKIINIKRGWQGDLQCVCYQEAETVDHMFVSCSISQCLWCWIAHYNNFIFLG